MFQPLKVALSIEKEEKRTFLNGSQMYWKKKKRIKVQGLLNIHAKVLSSYKVTFNIEKKKRRSKIADL